MASSHEDEDENVLLEKLKKDLKASVRDVYRTKATMAKHQFEEHKLRFTRAMEKAWLTNVIIKERYLRSRVKAIIADLALADTPDPEGYQLELKILDYNKKIRRDMSLGLEGIMLDLDPSNSNKQKLDQKEDKAELELKIFKDLNETNEDILLNMMTEHKEDLAKNFKYYYRRARRFETLESREEYLASIVISLHERESERREATENEILCYMLLKETANSSLEFPHVLTSPDQSMTRLNSVTPTTSIESEDEKMVVEIPKGVFTQDANEESDFETKSGSKIDSYQMEDMDEMKRQLASGRVVVEKSKAWIEMCDKLVCRLALERQFETKLVAHCENLSDIWLARCFNALSETETKHLKKIVCLAGEALDDYTHVAQKTLPIISLPILPIFRST